MNIKHKASGTKNLVEALHAISDVIEEADIALDDILRKASSIIASSFSAYTSSSVEIEIDHAQYHSEGFKRNDIFSEIPIQIDNQQLGSLRIFSGASDEQEPAAALSAEEHTFLQYITERLGRVVQRYRLSDELNRIRKKLELKEKQLDRKYIAMQELLDYIEFERRKRKDEIRCNIETSIKPIISNLKLSGEPQKYYRELENSIENLASKFNISLKTNYPMLTKKEREICSYLRDGLSSKEIGNLLNLSVQTVDKHRAHIRKKMGIIDRKITLAAYLETIEEQPLSAGVAAE